jgi:hypothetical protein
MMKDETDPVREALLDELLVRWWQWKAPMQPARGHGSVALGFEAFRVTRQYDDENGALYEDEEAQVMKAFEREVNALESQHRTVVYVMARALTLGVAVFTSPRIPQERQARELAVKAARAALAARLTDAGLM